MPQLIRRWKVWVSEQGSVQRPKWRGERHEDLHYSYATAALDEQILPSSLGFCAKTNDLD